MATSNDHPELQFVQARGFTAGRPDGPPLWIVWHDMEASETLTRAESTAAYFAAPPDDRRVSSHYCADADSVVQCVDLDDSAWTVGNRQGNNRGINWELAGFASQTRAQWLDPFGLAMLRRAAPIVRSDANRFGIPLRWLTDDQVRAMQPGMSTHVQLGRIFGGTTHTDPGPAFPYDVVLTIMKGDSSQMFIYHVNGTDSWFVSDGVRRRALASNVETRVRDTLVLAGAVNLGNISAPAGIAPDAYATIVGGPVDVELGSTGTGEIDSAAIRAAVRAELDRTKLTGP